MSRKQVLAICIKSHPCYTRAVTVGQKPTTTQRVTNAAVSKQSFKTFPLLISWSGFIGDFKCAVKEEVTLTSGEWEVLARHGSKVGYSAMEFYLREVITQHVVQTVAVQESVSTRF